MTKLTHAYSATYWWPNKSLIITIRYAAAIAKDKDRLQRVIRSAEKLIGCNLPSLQDLYTSRTLRRAGKIVADPSHPGHKLFETLPSGRRLWSIRTKTSRHKNSFFPSATSLINKAWSPPWHWLSPSPLQTFCVTLTHVYCVYISRFCKYIYIVCTNYTKSNSLHVQTYLAINSFLILILTGLTSLFL